MRERLKCFFHFAERFVDNELVGTFFEVDFSLEGISSAGGGRKDGIFVLHDLFIGIK